MKDPYPHLEKTDPTLLWRKDFQSDQEVRWCPGCGNHSILAQVQQTLPKLGIPKENFVCISGIGCSSRFPYYMGTYGIHTIHGRAPAIATGTKLINPDLQIWVITGDGDGLSIGGNHLIQAIRRNIDLKILLFNNRIYSLTKGQFSPTSKQGTKSKSSPMGSIDYPFNAISVALGADATFVARTIDSNPQHLQMVLERAARHKGTAFVEIYQNCIIFNDGAYSDITDKTQRSTHALFLENGKPLIYGAENELGIALDNRMRPVSVPIYDYGLRNILVHDESNPALAFFLSHFELPELPIPLGVFKDVQKPCYDQMLEEQIKSAKEAEPEASLESLFESGYTWTVN